MRLPRIPVRVLVPGGSLGVACALCVRAAMPLVQAVPLPTAAPSMPSFDEPATLSHDTVALADEEALIAVFDSDPFRPDRRAPQESWSVGTDSVVQPEPTGPIVLIGTAVLGGGGGFAMCQIGGEPARVVRIGQTLAGYTLRSVAQGRATFRAESGEVIEVRVAKTGTGT